MNKIAILLLFTFNICFVNAAIRLPVIYSDGMVLQRDTKFTINGWATPSEKVTLSFKGKKYNTKADKSGNWSLEIKDPVKVRYAWSDNPRDAIFYNKEGLPASPFQTSE